MGKMQGEKEGGRPMGFKEIGRQIQMAREEKGMTQVDLAQALGITQAALSNYELGKRRLYLHQIEGIARVLGKRLDFFISEEASSSPGSKGSARISTPGIVDRIADLEEGELRSLGEFLDYLEWRRSHVHSK
jgi:transcriptional regulator with XRE-family HTH domain